MQIIILYYTLIAIFIIIVEANYKNLKLSKNSLYFIYSTPLLIFFSFTAFRDYNIGTDTENYLYFFSKVIDSDNLSIFSTSRFEFLFIFISYIASFLENERFYLIIVSFIQTIAFFFAIRLWSKNPVVSFLFFCSLFVSYNLGTNILRQGLAIPFALISIHYLLEKKIRPFIIFLLISFFFHHTSIIMILFSFLCLNKFRIRTYIIFWLIAIILLYSGSLKFILELGRDLFSFNESYRNILSNFSLDSYQVGFRLDFILFSSIPILILLITNKKNIIKENIFLIKLYFSLNTFFILIMEIPYSDRFGLYSWILFPLLIPNLIKENKFKILRNNVIWLFLTFIAGVVSFVFYPIMQVSLNFNELI
ncbi:EpsG family protein [Proteus mirabilis]|uniref:EpsG family protein n=1 Tax=Proteus mirabilis TaxID=584 RepID=UPI0036ACDB27